MANHRDTHLYTYANFILQRARIDRDAMRTMRLKVQRHGHTHGELMLVEADPREYIAHGFTRCGQRTWGGPEGMNADERERFHIRLEVLAGAVPYSHDMEYTHYENIDGEGITHAAYFARLARNPFPSGAQALASRAKRMILSGFVQHRAFESCFEMGNGGEVMTLLIEQARHNEVLRSEIIRCEFHIGKWADLEQRYPFKPETRDLFERVSA